MSRVQAFDTALDGVKALLWQHDNAQRLKTLIELKQAWYTNAYSEFWDNWLRDVFNIDTANSFGLAVWSRILNIPLYVLSPADEGKRAWGFGPYNANFGNGNFGNTSANNIGLTVEQRRLVIRLRYAQLTSRGAVPETNVLLKALFGSMGNVFMVDNLDMTITYFFQFQPPRQLMFVLQNYDLLPRPAGVKVLYKFQPKASFGYGHEHLNFEHGNFGA